MHEPENGSAIAVSVIMPVRDMPLKLVRRAVRSVRRQDHHGAVEVVLWDDASENGDLARAYVNLADSFTEAKVPEGPRTVVARRSVRHRGIGASRNAAVDVATAEWLMWLDGDDELPRDAVRRLCAEVARSGHSYAVGQCKVVYPGGAFQVHRNRRYLREWRECAGSADDPLGRVVFNVHGGLVQRWLFEKTQGFDPYFSHAELVDWFRRLFRQLPERTAFDVLDAVTYVHHKRAGSHSTDRVRVHAQRREALERYAETAGMPLAVLAAAPSVNTETGCREYRRVEVDPGPVDPGSVDRELARLVPAGP